jgi:cold-inducible RNA-binding protein
MGTRLFVGNLAFDTTESSLTTAFANEGRKVVSVSIVADRDTGRSRGFAFVEMGSAGEAEAAIKALDGAQVNGRALRVSEAQERKSGPGGRGGQHRDNDA